MAVASPGPGSDAASSPLAAVVMVTVHPSFILRMSGAAERVVARRCFVGDLDAVVRRLEAG